MSQPGPRRPEAGQILTTVEAILGQIVGELNAVSSYFDTGFAVGALKNPLYGTLHDASGRLYDDAMALLSLVASENPQKTEAVDNVVNLENHKR